MKKNSSFLKRIQRLFGGLCPIFSFFPVFLNAKRFFLICIFLFLSLIFHPLIFPFFLVFKIPKWKVLFSISFIFYFLKFLNFQKNPINDVCSYPCNFFGGLVCIFQTCILMCITCLMWTLHNYEIPICDQCYSTPNVSLLIL